MRITELGEYSMVIMKDSEDPPWVSPGDIYRDASKYDKNILVDVGNQLTFNYREFSNYIYSGGRLILYFKNTIPSRFKLNSRVYLTTCYR